MPWRPDRLAPTRCHSSPGREPAPDECKRRGDRLTSSNPGIGCRKTTDSAQSSSNFGIWCRRIASWAENMSNTFVWCRSDRNGSPSIGLAARTGPDAQARAQARGPGAGHEATSGVGRSTRVPAAQPAFRPLNPRSGRSTRVPAAQPAFRPTSLCAPLKRATNPENRQGPRRSGASWG